MNLLLQTDPRLNVDDNTIGRWGCNILALLAIPQFMAQRALTAEEILGLHRIAIQVGAVSANGRFVNDNNRLIRIGCNHMGVTPIPIHLVDRFERATFKRHQHKTAAGDHFSIEEVSTGIHFDPDPSLRLTGRSVAFRYYG